MKLYVLGLLGLVWATCLLPIPGLKYSDRWVVQVNPMSSANQIAGRVGMKNLGRIVKDLDFYAFRQNKDDAQTLTNNLQKEKEVVWFSHEEVLPIVSRGGGGGASGTATYSTGSRTEGLKLNDTKWTDGMQWYLDKPAKNSLPTLNVREAWEQCVRGGGVTVAVVDDGIFYENEDLQDRVDLDVSYDVYTQKLDPKPQSEDYDHGTKVAGIIAGDTNGFCGVGVAFNVTLAGIRLLGGNITDDLIATALTINKDKVDVYVNSWGPLMDGTMLGAVGRVTEKALETSAKTGRQGKGSIFVWAGGNGGDEKIGDSCAYDGFVNSRHTIAMNGVTRFRKKLKTTESCSAVMATAYSKDEGTKDPIVTTTGIDGCTNNFGKSSAAAAFGAGIIALALQANGNLMWRDIQHLIAMTSQSNVKFTPNDWIINKANNKVSSTFGFGLLDAGKLVQYAKTWNNVQPVITCEAEAKLAKGTSVGNHELTVNNATCKKGIKYLEHVVVTFKLKYTARGYLKAKLISPSGTESVILPGRRKDAKVTDFDWSVMSVHFWGEPADGNWTVEFTDAFHDLKGKGVISSLKLTLYGTTENPRAGQNTSYSVANSESPCPVLAPFERIMGETDYTPLYIFIALVIIIAISIIGYFVWKKKLRDQEKCRMCGPKYKPAKGNTIQA